MSEHSDPSKLLDPTQWTAHGLHTAATFGVLLANVMSIGRVLVVVAKGRMAERRQRQKNESAKYAVDCEERIQAGHDRTAVLVEKLRLQAAQAERDAQVARLRVLELETQARAGPARGTPPGLAPTNRRTSRS